MLGLVAGAAGSIGASPAGGTSADAQHAVADSPPVLAAGTGITIRLPAGWRLVRGRLSDVMDPAPRLAFASFPVRLSKHECECGMPNPVSFPRNGAFVFVWEYRRMTRHDLLRAFPRRPPHFSVGGEPIQGYECAGPSETFGFSEAGRAFQVEVYLGAGVGPAARARLAAALDSFDASKLTPREIPGSRR